MPGDAHVMSPLGQHLAAKSGRNAPTLFFSALVTAYAIATDKHSPAAALLAFGPSRYYPPRHPTHFEPSFLELNGLRAKQKLAATSSKAF